MPGESDEVASFETHTELLQSFLDRRPAVVEKIEGILNAQRKPAAYLQDRAQLTRSIDESFFSSAASPDQLCLKGQLQAAHWAAGFRPRQGVGLHYDLIHPAEMMVRGFHCWQLTRWPGRNGRLHYANMLFNVYVLRCLEFLSMRLWDVEPGRAAARLTQLQELLDRLWSQSPSDQPVLVRDARWLIPLALSPATDELAPYFEVARHVAETLDSDDSLEIQRSHVRILGGHLTSQIRYYCIRDSVSFDDRSIVLRTRTSNALDFALLIQGLVPVLEAYERACEQGDQDARQKFAGAILQGVSPDPEVFLNRVDLLGPCSMIEHAFIASAPDGKVGYTAMGRRHIELIERYTASISRLVQPLLDDCPKFRPVDGRCSAFGVVSGNPTNVTELMALKTLQHEADPGFSLEDAFADGDDNGEKLAWVNGWRKLPHVDREVQEQYRYPQAFAEDIFARIECELRAAASGREAGDASGTGRLYIASDGDRPAATVAAGIPPLPARFVLSSDPALIAADKATAYEETELLRDRREGFFAASFPTSGGWVAISKDLFTEVLAAGNDAKIGELPEDAAQSLRLACLGLAAPV